MSYAACDAVGASAAATQVVVGLGTVVGLGSVVGFGGTVVAVVVGALVVGALVVGALVVGALVVGTLVAGVVVAAGAVVSGVEPVTVLDDDGDPPHPVRNAASAARARTAVGRIVR
jgi:hypothetical protein